ncbi:hypothetical protein MHUMG1_09619 [Metarhizium humberi]|uniref:FAD dependent oxidoreductase domain-containing protein n=1 Tax=Metarhizium humberi TaxID=2596975 RepID=A0A9P8M2P2_9HYPO|nr:hypothetical protein MHUMG1_09619 [Metarhizium humberi]
MLMAAQIPASLMAGLHAQALDDPQLPQLHPTTAFWQLPPHPTLSDVQSAKLPSTTDYAIIGSGVTGCSIANTLLYHPPRSSSVASSVTVLEARTLTSGATGRNGGLLTSYVPADYRFLSERFGHEQAVKIARFANRTLEKMHELGNSSDELKEVSEVRRLHQVLCYEDEEAFREARQSWQLYEEHVPEDRGKAKILSAEEAACKYNVRARAGAIVFNNGALWPYRLITRVWAQLYAKYKSRLSIETNTPVTSITYDPSTNSTHPYILHTPRGIIRASRIIHATNGHAGHLLPGLRGKIYPLRGTMSTQKAPAAFGRQGHEISWCFRSSADFNYAANTFEFGLYYSNQNPQTGDIFVGGEKAKLNELLISDDSQVGRPCVESISAVLPRYFTRGLEEGKGPEVKKVWSGIMGFTADGLPLVGRLPQSILNRGEEGGEWIAAGFNGHGMPQCWSSGEAVAKMLLGMDVTDFLPDVFLPTKERLEDEQRMATVPALERLLCSGWTEAV